MRPLFASALHWLHQLGLTLWLGGIAIVGAIMAPAVFGSARAAGETHHGTPLYDFASLVMTRAFERFNMLALVAGVLMLLGGVGAGRMSGLCRKGVLLRAGLTGLAWLGPLWLQFGMMPRMQAARAANDMELFQALHKTASHGFSAQMLLLLAVAALTAWLEAGKRTDAAPHPTTTRVDGAHPASAI